MSTKYQINGFLKFTEQDIYKDGCQPGTGSTFQLDTRFTGPTIESVIEQAAAFLGIGKDSIERNACDEAGRVDFAGMECDDSTQPSAGELASWKKGKTRLWYVVYTAHVERVTTAKIPTA